MDLDLLLFEFGISILGIRFLDLDSWTSSFGVRVWGLGYWESFFGVRSLAILVFAFLAFDSGVSMYAYIGGAGFC